MSCCCDTQVDGLYGLSGLNGLMGALASGSRIRTGFEFDWSPTLEYDPSERGDLPSREIQAVLMNYLNDGVTFDDVRVTVQLPTFFSDGYITVEATTKIELPDANVFGDMVQYGIETYLLTIRWTRRDETLIDYVAPAARNQPGVQQAGPPKICDWNTMSFRDYTDCQLGIGKFANQRTQQTQNQNQPGQPSKCAGMSPGNWIACQLGIESPLGGVAAGTVGALVGVGVLTLLAVVVLKR